MSHGHYSYNPYSDELELSSVRLLNMTAQYWEALAQTLDHMISLVHHHPAIPAFVPVSVGGTWVSAYHDADNAVGLIIRGIRQAARGYYEVWMIHHMIRVLVYGALGFDIADHYEFLKRVRAS